MNIYSEDIRTRWYRFISDVHYGQVGEEHIANLISYSQNIFELCDFVNPSFPTFTRNDKEDYEEAMHLWHFAAHSVKISFLEILIKNLQNVQINASLDLGCGFSEVLTFLRSENIIGGRIVGVDSSTYLLKTAKEVSRQVNIKAEYYRSNMAKLDLEDESFDLVIAIDSLHHCGDWQSPLSEMIRVAKPSGMVTIFSCRNCMTGLCYKALKRILQIKEISIIESHPSYEDRFFFVCQK